MRQIKFRAWDKNLKKWCEGNNASGFNLFGEALLLGGILQDHYYSHNVFERLFKDVEIMQFTGLHDKNGKEIWEGDIIRQKLGPKIADVIGPVFFIDGCFRIEYGDDSFDMVDRSDTNEVLGNIYENPDLLKENKQ